MTYQKKSFYGAPTLTGNNISFDNIDLSCLRQINSNMIVNKITIESSNIDVDNLYQSEIMKK